MVNAHELRIGNWIAQSDDSEVWNSPGSMVKVTTNLLFGIEAYPDYHHPIPLTPEILEKCGFSKTRYDGESWYEYEAKNGIVFCECDKNGYCEVSLDLYDCIRVKYVHELQNLYFAITGQELNIEI